MRQKHRWTYFAFNQSFLAKGKIAPTCFCLMRQNKNTWFYMRGSGLDRTDDFQIFCRSGLDRIQFFRIRIGLGLKIFTVHSSLLSTFGEVSCCFWANFLFSNSMAGRQMCLEVTEWNLFSDLKRTKCSGSVSYIVHRWYKDLAFVSDNPYAWFGFVGKLPVMIAE